VFEQLGDEPAKAEGALGFQRGIVVLKGGRRARGLQGLARECRCEFGARCGYWGLLTFAQVGDVRIGALEDES
jgi:hypothetical protein